MTVSFSTFARLRPQNVYKIDQTPDRQCICDKCEKFRLVRRTLNRLGIKGVPLHSKECIQMSLCKVDDNNADSNNSNTNSDACQQMLNLMSSCLSTVSGVGRRKLLRLGF